MFFLNLLLENKVYISLVTCGICGILSFMILMVRGVSKVRKISIFFLEFISMLQMICDMVYSYYLGEPGETVHTILRIAKFLSDMMNIFIMFSFNEYLVTLFSENDGQSKTKTAVPYMLIICRIALLIAMYLLIVSLFNGMYYSFDENNMYHRSPLIFLSYIGPCVTLLLQFITLIKYKKKIRIKVWIPLLMFTIIPIVMVVIRCFISGLSFLTTFSSSCMAILVYVFVVQDMNESVERAHRLEVELLKRYKEQLERTVDERTRELKVANEKAETLLLNILPKDIAVELTEHPGCTIANDYQEVSVLFTDVVGFTNMSSKMSARQIVDILNGVFSLMDERAKREGIEKIKTIGDAYMAVTGLNGKNGREGAVAMINFAKGLLEDLRAFNEKSEVKLQIRIGINTGNLVGGVIGKTKFIYDVWGDTVNVASRMESSGRPMEIHVTEKTHELCKNDFSFGSSVEMEIKGKGMMNTYFIV